MKITVLIENGTCAVNPAHVKPEHGISLYIETQGKKILFDVGKTDRFYENARKLGIDLSAVEYLFISHGHFDHGGGLKKFLEINDKAKIYLHRKAVEKHYAKLLGLIPVYIGLDQKLIEQHAHRFVWIDKNTQVEKNIHLLENFEHRFPLPKGNKNLYEKTGNRMVKDSFKHEIVLVLQEAGKNVVFTACSHSGVINMYEKAKKYLNGQEITAVLGGFHIFNPVTRQNESKDYLDKLARAIEETEAVFYTGHCTGEKNFKYLKNSLQEQLQSMHTGAVIEI